MEVVYLPQALEDIKYWKKSGNKAIQQKISRLLEDMTRSPIQGLGKPEQLKHNLSGLWSRRIDSEHRIVYEINETKIFIYSLRGHY